MLDIKRKTREKPNDVMTPYDQVLGDGGKEEFPLAEPASVRVSSECDWLEGRGEEGKQRYRSVKIETTLSLCSMLAALTAAC